MVYFVGAGCGAADLITVRGMKLLQKADVVIYAGSLVNPELLDYAKAGCKIFNSATMTQEEVVSEMKSAEEKNLMTVRLHTGDQSIYITNPGNPTGVVLTPEELQLMVDIAVEHDLFLIGDEVYREFVYGGEPLMSLGQYPKANDNVIIIDSVSKRFSACGARIGTVITRNKELQGHMMKICQARLSVATLDQIASAALYSVPADYFDAVRAEYKERRDTLYRKLMEIPGVVCKEPKGAFYVMAKLPVDDTEKFLIWLLTEFEDNGETVMYAPGGGFYATAGKGKDEVRFAYILKKEDLERAMDLLAMGIKKYNETH